jgi:hypothetical protein
MLQLHDFEGTVLGVLSAYSDITERKYWRWICAMQCESQSSQI